MVSKIDNPGGGDCGFYAFSIGLIDIIQKEHQANRTSPTFQRWKKASQYDKKIMLDNILKLDLHKLRQAPLDYKEELFPLQSALRSMLAESTKQELLRSIQTDSLLDDKTSSQVESSPVFGKFMELVNARLEEKTLSSNYNELALSPQVIKLAEQTAVALKPKLENKPFAERQQIENLHVKQVLIDNVMDMDFCKLNPNAAIIKGIDEVKQQGRWATHNDLKDIAAVLEVNLFVSGEKNGVLEPKKPTVSLNNHNNAHWTTNVELSPKPVPVHKPAKKETGSRAPSIVPSEDIKVKESYSFIEKQLKLTQPEKEFVAHHSSGSSENDSLKIELAKLLKMRQSIAYQEKIKIVESKATETLSDEELAYKLQEEEFRNPSLKPYSF